MNKSPTVESVLLAIDRALENENRHGESVTAIWAKLKKYVKPGMENDAVMELGNALNVEWRKRL